MQDPVVQAVAVPTRTSAVLASALPWFYECPPAYEQAVSEADDPHPDRREEIRNPGSRLWVGEAPPAYQAKVGIQTDGADDVQLSVEATNEANAANAPIVPASNWRERPQSWPFLPRANSREAYMRVRSSWILGNG
ncbi:hypothetical protein [Bordetella sp. LUAb4]|uniref:hypothetical protein n=1 Tax=Bordetella sp. LUAb4 TaxID=2843195 RepID=UPI001E475108|nr:hypothetical protein [Bordetella sp. LUAb4]